MKITQSNALPTFGIAHEELVNGRVYYDNEGDGPFLKTNVGLVWLDDGVCQTTASEFTYRLVDVELLVNN